MYRHILLLWSRRHLVSAMVRTEIQLLYQHKVLGWLWTVLDPLMMMSVYVLVIVLIFKQGGPRFPAEVFSAIIAWRWFNQTVKRSVTSITGKGRLIRTVAFPKSVLPLSNTIVGLINYLFGLLALAPILVLFHATLGPNVLWLPLIVVSQFVFTLGFALIVAALGVYFRDLENILSFGLRMWWYLSPGLYVVEGRIPPALRSIYMLNPLAGLLTSYKNILVYGRPPDPYLAVAPALGLVLIAVGLAVYSAKDSQFAKEI